MKSCGHLLSLAVVAKFAVDRIVVKEAFALGALCVVVIAARVANIDIIAICVDSEGNVIDREIFIALRAKQIFVVKATGTNVGAVVNNGHFAFVEVLLAMLAKAIVLVEAVVADVDAFAVAIDNLPSFGAKILALLTEFGLVVAVVAEKFGRKFADAGNANSIGADLEDLEVVGMVGVRPVRIAAEAVPARDTNVMLVAAVFFGLPEIGNALKRGEFALNQIAIELGFGLGTTSTAVSVVKAALKQKSIERLIHEKLPRRLTIIESFGLIGVGGSEDDEGHVVAGVAGTATVIIAIEDVEGVARSHSGAALVPFRIAHCQEMRGVDRDEKLEVNLFCGKLVGELREEMLELTVLA